MGFAQLCGQIAPIASVVVFMAPLPTMKQISEDKSVGALPLLPYTSMCLSATLWALYGLLKDDPNIWITNLVGLAMGSYYFYHFTRHAPKKSSSLPGTVQQHVQAIGIVGATSLLLFFSKTAFSVDLIGYAAVILCLAMFASPLSALQTVIQVRICLLYFRLFSQRWQPRYRQGPPSPFHCHSLWLLL